MLLNGQEILHGWRVEPRYIPFDIVSATPQKATCHWGASHLLIENAKLYKNRGAFNRSFEMSCSNSGCNLVLDGVQQQALKPQASKPPITDNKPPVPGS